MLLGAMVASVSALRVSGQRLSQTAHNVANVSTPGFVPQRLELGDVATGGVQVIGQSNLSSGPIVTSSGPLDLAINGPGYFILNDGAGGQVYTRAGNFSLNQDGQMVDQMGRVLQPGITIPPEASQVSITPQGQIQALDNQGQVLFQGQLQTATFANTGGLEAIGGNAYRATAASGQAMLDNPGVQGHGSIVPGALQASGTDLASEMVNLITTQRSFEANVRAVQTWDETVGSVLDIVG